MTVNAKITARLTERLKRFQPILSSAKARDINESDTVVIVTDILSDLLGYDKYSEITTEHSIRGTWCDLAIVINEQFKLLIEVKAIGLELKDAHVKQAVDYAANKGVDWVVLTNGTKWQVYKISFTKPINQELILDLDLLSLNHKKKDDVYCTFLLSKEGLLKDALGDFSNQRQATSKYLIANLLITDSVLNSIRHELRHIYPDIKVQTEDIKDTILEEILKRDVVEGDKALQAQKKIQKSIRKLLKKNKPEIEKEPAIK
ncbi:restriction endonuclease subunit R [Candidatus Wirthbacteria bacterium CG2_30_54_11]|uniref:Restriction endonuclease subunit R n=1 Tax=Candidatus Wirthbacteria bacterium CG2_30_54_11 TaxID=1817892 RepID=A0A1J5IQ75_9BACT|nr:MAG: restriction endonuclease subunit R [Candidatus Wirthbacteria bacterium CG2_30_54_11]